MGYHSDRALSDAYLPAIKNIVGPLLLEPASFELDTKEATDLIVFKARDMRIAARVRSYGYERQYPFQFTIRAKRKSGSKTELSKVVDGWGDWFFYGHAVGGDGYGISRWMIIDLAAFRSHLIRRTIAKDSTGLTPNKDGTTEFRWFDVRGFSAAHMPILVAASFSISSEVAA